MGQRERRVEEEKATSVTYTAHKRTSQVVFCCFKLRRSFTQQPTRCSVVFGPRFSAFYAVCGFQWAGFSPIRKDVVSFNRIFPLPLTKTRNYILYSFGQKIVQGSCISLRVVLFIHLFLFFTYIFQFSIVESNKLKKMNRQN